MTLLTPLWFWTLLFLALYFVYLRQRGRGVVWNLRSVLLMTAIGLGIVALARPVSLQEPVSIEQRGSDVIFAVDISHSMQAADIAPSRLAAAKSLLSSVVEADDANRFGVLAFTTNPVILSPLTRDDELLLHLFAGLDTSMVMTRGTEIGGALKLARKLSRSEHPIVVLLTDGGDSLGYSQEAAQARAAGLIVNVVMLATPSGGTLKAEDGKLLRDEEGGIVVTARNSAIGAIADATGGVVIDGADAGALAAAIKAQGMQDVREKRKIILYREYFYYPLALALLLAMLGMTDLLSRLGGRRA
ncbi:VWA domain-containing protein [Sulfurimonas sp. HSL1-6]|uniref:VWA domain-containing protein n=1 Tax=Thiomicrolovo immobilis TaxID=3131935 RepID=UPI0031F8C715